MMRLSWLYLVSDLLIGLIGDLLSFLVGRYYLADTGYTDMPSYMTPSETQGIISMILGA